MHALLCLDDEAPDYDADVRDAEARQHDPTLPAEWQYMAVAQLLRPGRRWLEEQTTLMSASNSRSSAEQYSAVTEPTNTSTRLSSAVLPCCGAVLVVRSSGRL